MSKQSVREFLDEMEKVFEEVDYSDSIYEQQKASQDFNSGQLIVAKDCSFSLNDFGTKLNNNVLIVGGSGTGKTEHIVKPNLREAVGSYVICDPKGQLYKTWSGYLKGKGYDIRLIDFTSPERSDGYNPMSYFRKNTQNIVKFASTIVNTKESLGTNADPYWDRMTTLLLCALIGYMVETDQPEMTFTEILRMLSLGERFDETDKSSELQSMFISHKRRHPDSWACEKFDAVDTAPYKTFDTIRSTLAAKFANFDSKELRQMMSRQGLEFKDISSRKTAVFVTVSDTDRAMDMLVNIFFTQAMNELCQYADNCCENGRLPIPVRFILDDFATNCRIDEFPRMISSIRSRAISVMLMIQAEAQLRQGYDDDAQTIISNCDTYVYLGGNDVQTAQAVSERCDKQLSEVLYMPVGSCWVFRRGSKPKYSQQTDISDIRREIGK